MNNLLNFYKAKNYKIYNIEYQKNDNIFNRSILLDSVLGEETIQDALRYGNNKENKKNFLVDNQLIAKFNNAIKISKFPNADDKNKNKYNKINNKFSNNINDYYIKETEKHTNILFKENKIKLKKKKREKRDKIGKKIKL